MPSLRSILIPACALVALPVLSACDNSTSPGAAAVVGSHQVSTGELQSQVNVALADPTVRTALATPAAGSPGLGGDRAGFTRQTLGRLISDQLLGLVAAAHHVTVTPQEISQQEASFEQQAGGKSALEQSAASQVGVAPSQLPGLIRITVLEQKLGSALTANLPASQAQLKAQYQKDIDQYDQLDVAQIAVTSKTLANRILHQVQAHPASFAALAQKYSTDTQSKSNGGEVGLVGRSQVVQLLGGKASAAKPGTFTLAHSGSTYIVLHIIKRQVQPLSAVTDKVKASLFASQANALLGKAVSAEATTLGVHVNPRYGRWDNTTQSVVPATNAVSSPASPTASPLSSSPG